MLRSWLSCLHSWSVFGQVGGASLIGKLLRDRPAIKSFVIVLSKITGFDPVQPFI